MIARSGLYQMRYANYAVPSQALIIVSGGSDHAVTTDGASGWGIHQEQPM
jgi:hypothetical protein